MIINVSNLSKNSFQISISNLIKTYLTELSGSYKAKSPFINYFFSYSIYGNLLHYLIQQFRYYFYNSPQIQKILMNAQQKRNNKRRIRQSLQLQLFGEKQNFEQNNSSSFTSITGELSTQNKYSVSSNFCQSNKHNQNSNEVTSKGRRNFYDHYILGSKIGEGTQSVVYKCYKISTNQLMAVKVMGNLEEQSILAIQNQYQTLRNLEHNNIISAKDLFINNKERTAHLILQFCEYPNLREIMTKTTKIQEKSIKKILLKILKAVKYFHQKGVCHRDLKPENILCSEDFKHLKIVDFDISRSSNNNQPLMMMTDTGSLLYRAPETFGALYGQEVDIWSVGVIAFELLTGKLPFHSEYKNTTIKMIKQHELNLNQFGISNEGCKLLNKLLEKNPMKRATVQIALKTQFLLIGEQIKNKYQSTSQTDTVDDYCHEIEEIY